MYKPHPGFRTVAVGILLALLDIKIGGFDLLPDLLGYTLMGWGLLSIPTRYRSLSIASVCAFAMLLLEVNRTFIAPSVPPTPVLGDSMFVINNDLFWYNWSWQVLLDSALDLMFYWFLQDGLIYFFADRGDEQDAKAALRRRDQFALIAVLSVAAIVYAVASPAYGLWALLVLLLCEFLLALITVGTLRFAARPPRPDDVLQHLLVPAPRPSSRLFQASDTMTRSGKALALGAAIAYPFVIWFSITPCSPLDRVMRKTGCVALLAEHRSHMTGFAFSPDGRLVVSNSSGFVRQLDIATQDTVRLLSTQSARGYSVAVSPNGQAIVASQRRGIMLWRDAAPSVEITSTVSIGNGGLLVFSPDGTTFAATDDDGVVSIWRTQDGERLHELRGLDPYTIGIHYSARGTLVVATETRIAEWHVSDGSLVQLVEMPGKTIVALAPDASFVAATGDCHIGLYEVRTGVLIRELEQTNGDNRVTIAISHDGMKLATMASWDEQTIEVRSILDGALIKTLPIPSSTGHSSWGIREMHFSPDDRLIAASGVASGRGANNVAVWRVP